MCDKRDVTILIFFITIVVLGITLCIVGNKLDKYQTIDSNKKGTLIIKNDTWQVYQLNDSTLLYVPYCNADNTLKPYTEKINNSNYETPSTISIESKGY